MLALGAMAGAGASLPAAAQEARVFDLLAGAWEGEGTLLGRPAWFTMRWERHDGFAVLTFRNAFVGEDGGRTTVLSSVATYRTSESMPEAVWLDSRGERIEIRWERTDSTLVARWRAPTEEGRTTYRVDGPGAVEVRDEVLGGDGWRVFGTARLLRIDASDGAPGRERRR